jgi:ankyrin repeat protein
MFLTHLKSLLNKYNNFRSNLIKLILDEFYENVSEETIISFKDISAILQENGMDVVQPSELKSSESVAQDDSSLFYFFITGKNLEAHIKQKEVTTLHLLPSELKGSVLYPFLDSKSIINLATCSYENYKEMKDDSWKRKIISTTRYGEKLVEIDLVQNYKRLYQHVSNFYSTYGFYDLPLWSLLCLSGEIPAIEHAIKYEGLSAQSEHNSFNALFFTMLSGSINAVEFVLALGCSHTSVHKPPPTLFHWAALSGSVTAIRYAVNTLKNSPQSCDDYGRNALNYAIMSGSIKAIKYILSLGISAGNVDIDQNNAMHFAALYGNATVVSWLLQHASTLKLDLKAVNKAGEDVFALLAKKFNKDQKVLDLFNASSSLLENTMTFSKKLLDKTAMRKDGLEILLKKHDNFRSSLMKLILDEFYGNTPAETGISFKEIVDHLQKNGIIFTTLAETIEKDNNIGLFYLFITGEYRVLVKEPEEQKGIKIVDSLPSDLKVNILMPFFTFKMLVDLSVTSSSHYGAVNNDFWIKKVDLILGSNIVKPIKKMLEEKIIHFKNLPHLYRCIENLFTWYGIDARDLPAWSLHCMSGEVSAINYAFAHGLGQDTRADFNAGALHFAAFSGSVELMKIAVSMGCLPSAVDNYRRNVLHYAAWSGSVEAMKYAIDILKISPFSMGNNETSIVHFAAMSGSIEAVKYASSLGDSISLCKQKMTVLHWAVQFGRTALVAWLCQKGLKAKEIYGQDVFALAVKLKNQEIQKILTSALENKKTQIDTKPIEKVPTGEFHLVSLAKMQKPIGEQKHFTSSQFFKSQETSQTEKLSIIKRQPKDENIQQPEEQSNCFSNCLMM